jgi:type I restriction enzyme R subunit
MPFFRMFERELFGENAAVGLFEAAEKSPPFVPLTSEERISRLVDLTQKSFLAVERELKLTGFWESIPARNKLKAELQKTLLAQEFANLPGVVSNRAHILSRIMEIAEKNHDTILYAE